MLRDLAINDWTRIGTLVALMLTFSGFAWVVIATLRYPRSKMDKLARLPWDKEEKNSP